MNERRQIAIVYTCSDGRVYPTQHEAQQHQDELNIGAYLDVEFCNAPGPVPIEAAKWIIDNSSWLFSILSKYYETTPEHDN